MHDAFDCVAILERLPLEIDCIASSGKTLFVGTNKGHLLVYAIHEEDPSTGVKYPEGKFEVELQRSNKAFGRKPIAQLVALEEYNIIVSLSDGCVNVHDFNNYNPKQSLGKGILYFSIDQKPSNNDKEPLRLCAVSKRKISTYYWKKDKFVELYGDLTLPDTPKIAVWVGDSICFAMKKDYALMKADTGKFFQTNFKKRARLRFIIDNNFLSSFFSPTTCFNFVLNIFNFS